LSSLFHAQTEIDKANRMEIEAKKIKWIWDSYTLRVCEKVPANKR
jgi:hypothetical protein